MIEIPGLTTGTVVAGETSGTFSLGGSKISAHSGAPPPSSIGYAAADVLALPPLRSSVLVVAPNVELPSATAVPIASSHSGMSAGIGVRAKRGTAAGGAGVGFDGGGAGPGAGGSAVAPDLGGGGGGAEEPPMDPRDAAALTARKLAVSRAVYDGPKMKAYREEEAAAYGHVMRQLERVDVASTRSLGMHTKLRDGHASGVTALAYDDAGGFLASGAADGLLLLWDLDKHGYERVMDNHSSAITSISWHPDRKMNCFASSSADSTVKIWDVDRAMPLITLRDHGRHSVSCVAYSSDGDMMATAGGSRYIFVYNMQRMAVNWALSRRKSKEMMLCVVSPAEAGNADGHSGTITRLAWSKGNDLIASASEDGSARVWRIPHGGRFSFALTGHKGSVSDVSFCPLSERLLTAGADGTARTWSVEDGSPLKVMSGGHRGPIAAAVFTPEGGGRRVVTGGRIDGVLCLWDSYAGMLLQRLEGLHGGQSILCLSPRPDGLQVASGSADKSIGVWRAVAPTCWEWFSWGVKGCCATLCGGSGDDGIDASGDGDGQDKGEDADGDEGGSGSKGKGKGDALSSGSGSASSEAAREREARLAEKKADGLAALRKHKQAGGSSSSGGGGGGKSKGKGADAEISPRSSPSGSPSGSDVEEGEGRDTYDETAAYGSGHSGKSKVIAVKPKRNTHMARDFGAEALSPGRGGASASAAGEEVVTAEAMSARVAPRGIVSNAARAARSSYTSPRTAIL